MIPRSDYKKIHNRPGRPSGIEEGFELTSHDEEVLDRAWAKSAEKRGVEQIANQPSEEEIKNFRP